MSVPRVEAVIIASEQRGHGKPGSPTRLVRRVYTLQGDFVAEWDPINGEDAVSLGEVMGSKDRITCRLPVEAIEGVDGLVEAGLYESRSAAVRDALASFMEVRRAQQ